jgi:hypothetical protein
VDVLTASCDKRFLYVVARENGLIIVDVQNLTSPKIVGSLPSIGNEGITISAVNCSILLWAEGYKGLTVVDVSDVSRPRRLATLPLGGWCTLIRVTRDQRFAFASQQDNDEIVLLDISNITNPFII